MLTSNAIAMAVAKNSIEKVGVTEKCSDVFNVSVTVLSVTIPVLTLYH